MVGFIKGFLGGQKKDEDAAVQLPKPQPEVRVPVEKDTLAYFLDTDSAQSMGNAEYMRTSRSVRRTFPKTRDQPETPEFIQEVSAMKQAVVTKNQAAASGSTTQSSAQAAAPKADPSADRRRVDSSMDMFRNMAKDMKK
jgi:hypothetical protein